jgi:SAM-dependent methyltransferase
MSEAAWDERYRSREALWSDEPNSTLVTEVSPLEPGSAVEVGCGEGADAIWLAKRGWRVTGLDFSRVALARAANAEERYRNEIATPIVWQHADLLAWTPGLARFDLVTAHFIQFREEERVRFFSTLAACVSPGGTLLVVGHDPSDLATNVRRPPDPAVLYTVGDIAGALDAHVWDIVVCEARPRSAIDRDERPATVNDAIVRARRRATARSPHS